jgi:hypothetical protein
MGKGEMPLLLIALILCKFQCGVNQNFGEDRTFFSCDDEQGFEYFVVAKEVAAALIVVEIDEHVDAVLAFDRMICFHNANVF